MEPQLSNPSSGDEMRFLNTKYGKNYVQLLHVRRDNVKHMIREIEVNVALSLKSQKDYLVGDNTEIIATDSQKNTVYALAKQYGVESVEGFGILLCRHFIDKYQQVTSVRIKLEEFPWRRIQMDNEKHVHAFVHIPESVHLCTVELSRQGKPTVQSGIRKFRIIKTTQSAFVNFVRDEFTSLPNMADRIFCTEVNATWTYNALEDVDFQDTWKKVKVAILDSFAGPPKTGIFSSSVQQTIYNTQKLVLTRIPQINSIEVELPNIHYYPADFSKLPALGLRHNDEVFLPSEKPSGNIYAKVERVAKSHL